MINKEGECISIKDLHLFTIVNTGALCHICANNNKEISVKQINKLNLYLEIVCNYSNNSTDWNVWECERLVGFCLLLINSIIINSSLVPSCFTTTKDPHLDIHISCRQQLEYIIKQGSYQKKNRDKIIWLNSFTGMALCGGPPKGVLYRAGQNLVNFLSLLSSLRQCVCTYLLLSSFT